MTRHVLFQASDKTRMTESNTFWSIILYIFILTIQGRFTYFNLRFFLYLMIYVLKMRGNPLNFHLNIDFYSCYDMKLIFKLGKF